MAKIKVSCGILAACSLLFSGVSFACGPCSGIVINGGAGVARVATLHTSDVQVQPTEVDSLTKANTSQNKFTGYVGLGYDFIVAPDAADPNAPYLLRDIAIGVNLYHTQSDRDGQVYSVNTPNNKNANYKEQIKSNRLMLDTEWSFHPIWPLIIPFIEAGAGATKNQMEFQQTPRAGNTTVSNLNLSEESQYQFAWEAGGGIKIPVNNHFQVTGRYLYTGLGSAQSSKNNKNGPALQKPITTDLHAQSVILGLSILFG
jgi:opacity protein-like surface antigen